MSNLIENPLLVLSFCILGAVLNPVENEKIEVSFERKREKSGNITLIIKL